MIQTATVTLKKGEETVKRDLADETGIKPGDHYVIGGEDWVVDKIHGKEPEEKKPETKPTPAKPAQAKQHMKKSRRH